jgi:hypothetical protein
LPGAWAVTRGEKSEWFCHVGRRSVDMVRTAGVSPGCATTALAHRPARNSSRSQQALPAEIGKPPVAAFTDIISARPLNGDAFSPSRAQRARVRSCEDLAASSLDPECISGEIRNQARRTNDQSCSKPSWLPIARRLRHRRVGGVSARTEPRRRWPVRLLGRPLPVSSKQPKTAATDGHPKFNA